ncbi:MAG: TPM domain-containing protein [Mucilaginibacter polytrichastri]|nr:TPM domain-containing protein [Mucilaginibacter polytrichastri]
MPATLFTHEEQALIKTAIENAERRTSGEIRVSIDRTCSEDVLDRAAYYFVKLNMQHTRQRNGVLIYVAAVDRKFAIIGDSGINKVVPADFWDTTRNAMLTHFKVGDIAHGIITGIEKAGEQLRKFFPYQFNDENELPDDIAFMQGS